MKNYVIIFAAATLVIFAIGVLSAQYVSFLAISLKGSWVGSKSGRLQEGLEVLEMHSSHDAEVQLASASLNQTGVLRPLIVSLHTWSGSYSDPDPLAALAITEGWNYIHPDFRGPNWTQEACLSNAVISDIDDAIQFAIDHGSVDQKNIFLVGASGGGYTTLGAYLRIKRKIRLFQAWVPISDLSAWYYQSAYRAGDISEQIIKCSSPSEVFDEEAAKSRSPIFWDVPKPANGRLELYAGIDDGYTGSVPISHSIQFYNRLVSEYGNQAQIVENSVVVSLLTRGPESTVNSKVIDGRTVFLAKITPEVSLTIFQGGHEMLVEYAFERMKHIYESP
jgi:pimeloyl-ACP methyl ester carboxylesterase